MDQDVYEVTARFLKVLGHDTVSAAEIGLCQATDLELISRAEELGRILVTRDRDFGGLVFLRGIGAGVIYLRLLPSTLRAAHEELKIVLTSYSEDALRKAFVVVEPGRHRFRRLSR